MKTIITIHKWLRMLVAIVLIFIGTGMMHAQEAFYIYRNDGNFDGFFFDEIVRMGYSKVGLDSVEYDVFVVQEIETADSIYRIPLAAIDSVGFQQPEIRLNPRFKNMDELGITPYITQTSGWSSARLGLSKSIPSHLLPQVGDVMATWDPSIYGGKGWVYKITGTSSPAAWLDEDDNSYYYNVEDVEDINDIFDQYITVEDIGFDEHNNIVRRRIAGCNPDGTIRRAKEGSGEVNLINLSGTFSREWLPGGDSKISLSADVGVKLRLRVAYNIGLKRLFVKLSRDLIIKAEPSVSMSVSKGFEYSIGEIYGLPGITFPATCPIFETNPVPDIFVRGEGSLKAALKFPAVQLGVGEDIIIDSNNAFPISYDLHLIPSEDKGNEDILDCTSASVSFEGYLQAGVKFTANLATASWFSSILYGDIGLNLYCGPKVDGKVEFTKTFSEIATEDGGSYDPFWLLDACSLNLSLLSFDLEAKAMAALLWQDPEETTFFSKNWSFLCDTIRFIPKFEKTDIKIENNTVTATMHAKPYKILGYTVVSAGVVAVGSDKILKQFGDIAYSPNKQEYTVSFSLDELKELKSGYPYEYCIRPVVAWAGREPHVVGGCQSKEFYVPAWIEVNNTELEFGATDNLEQKVRIRTNKALKTTDGFISSGYGGIENEYYNYNYRGSYKNAVWEYQVEAIDADKGIYDVTFKVKPNTDMFYREMKEKDGGLGEVWDDNSLSYVTGFIHACPYILVPKAYGKYPEAYHEESLRFPLVVDTLFFTFRQAGSDEAITGRQVKFSASNFAAECAQSMGISRINSYSLTNYTFGNTDKESMTMERDGDSRVAVTCSVSENSSETYMASGENYTRTYKEQGTMTFVIARSNECNWEQNFHDIVEGTCSSTVNTTDNGKKTEYNTPTPRAQQTTNFTFSANHDAAKELKSATTTINYTKYDGSTVNKSHSLTSTSNKEFTISY